MVHSKRYRVMIIGIILICIFAFAGCGNESTHPNQTTTASTEPSTSTASAAPAVSPESGLAAWGATLRLSVPEGATGVSVTRTVVNHLGQELSAEYDVPCSAAGEVTHTPFGGIFAAPCPDGTVYVDGKRLDEPYVTEKSFGDCNIELPYQVPESRYFCMGDHRSTSADSRHSEVGCVAEEQVVGKIVWRVWPLAGFGRLS